MYPRKLCKVCHLFKLYNPSEKLQSKACGFVGKVCWDCHVANQTRRLQGKPPLRYPVPAALAQYDALQDELKALDKILCTEADLVPEVHAVASAARQAKIQELHDFMQTLRGD